MPRLFIAIDLPAEIKEAIGLLRSALPGARWTADNQLHLTLRFIGEMADERHHELRNRLHEVTRKPFPLHIKGLGVFPPGGRPRILWVGLKKSDALAELRKKVDSILRQLDIDPEKKKFSPHITIARLNKTPGPELAAYLADNDHFRQPPFRVNAFRLYASTLSPAGASHSCEAEYLLTSPRPRKP